VLLVNVVFFRRLSSEYQALVQTLITSSTRLRFPQRSVGAARTPRDVRPLASALASSSKARSRVCSLMAPASDIEGGTDESHRTFYNERSSSEKPSAAARAYSRPTLVLPGRDPRCSGRPGRRLRRSASADVPRRRRYRAEHDVGTQVSRMIPSNAWTNFSTSSSVLYGARPARMNPPLFPMPILSASVEA
jgi:hypothetical protein